jgi:hypothetical protein
MGSNPISSVVKSFLLKQSKESLPIPPFGMAIPKGGIGEENLSSLGETQFIREKFSRSL